MILHICEDNRFVAMAKNQFDRLDSNRHFYLVNASNTKSLKYLSNINNIATHKANTIEHRNILNKQKWEAIIFHNCNQKYKWEIINKLPSNQLVIWLSWGSDIYMLPKFRETLYDKKTEAIRLKLNKTSLNINTDHIIRVLLGKYKKQIKAYRRINYCAPVMEEDLNLLNSKYNLNISATTFSYGDLSYYLGGNIDKVIDGSNIIIGNSADLSNNHLEAFELLKNISINDRRIITPLSYGGNKKYVNLIINEGRSLFRESFLPLTDLMPLDDYRKLLYSCSIAIMNHKRQQALGNIIMLLWMGVKLYLNPENPVYTFLLKNNITVFQISDLNTINPLSFQALDKKEVNNNRIQLLKLYSEQNVQKKTQQIIDLIDGI